MKRRNTPLRLHYFWKLILLLLSSYIIFFIFLCLVEFRKAVFDPDKFSEAAHEVGVFMVVGIASLPIAILIAWRLTQRLLLPLKEMAQTANQISNGEFSRRISLNETYDELDQLAATFNLAFNRYEATLSQLRSFSGDAAHQLRTPIAAIRSTGETALISTRTPDEYAQTIGQMLEELERLNGTVDQLLQLAKLEAGTLRKSFQSCSTADAIRTTVDRFAPLAEIKNITVETSLDDSFRVEGISDLIEQAIANLLDNAIRHTPDNGNIRIIQKAGTISVEDSGPGIPADLLPHLFEQFRTGDETGQNGLGLAIVERIIELHCGSVHAQNRSSGGASFSIQFEDPLKSR